MNSLNFWKMSCTAYRRTVQHGIARARFSSIYAGVSIGVSIGVSAGVSADLVRPGEELLQQHDHLVAADELLRVHVHALQDLLVLRAPQREAVFQRKDGGVLSRGQSGSKEARRTISEGRNERRCISHRRQWNAQLKGATSATEESGTRRTKAVSSPRKAVEHTEQG